MYKLFRDAFELFLTAVYINCRGESDTQTIHTGETFSYSCPTGQDLLKLTSKEYKHETSFKHWYMPKQVRYTYLVSVNKHSEEVDELVEVLPMPMLCSKRFAGTTLPHRLAISECLTRFLPT